MSGSTKKRKVIGLLRAIFANNLKRALEKRFPHTENLPMAAETESRGALQHSSIQRWLICEVSPNLDQVEAVADFLKIKPQELLTAYHGVQDGLSIAAQHSASPLNDVQKTVRQRSIKLGGNPPS